MVWRDTQRVAERREPAGGGGSSIQSGTATARNSLPPTFFLTNFASFFPPQSLHVGSPTPSYLLRLWVFAISPLRIMAARCRRTKKEKEKEEWDRKRMNGGRAEDKRTEERGRTNEHFHLKDASWSWTAAAAAGSDRHNEHTVFAVQSKSPPP